MHIYTRFFVLLTFLFLTSCSSQKILDQYTGTKIVFGNGGGFTRQVSEYTLSTDGKLMYVKGIQNDTAWLTPLSKKATAGIFKEFSRLGIDTLSFQHPGDKYYFIREVKEKPVHEVVWGDPSYTTPAGVQELYELLISKTNN